MIFPCFIDANAIIREGLSGVKVKDEKKARSFICDHLIAPVFERDVCLLMIQVSSIDVYHVISDPDLRS